MVMPYTIGIHNTVVELLRRSIAAASRLRNKVIDSSRAMFVISLEIKYNTTCSGVGDTFCGRIRVGVCASGCVECDCLKLIRQTIFMSEWMDVVRCIRINVANNTRKWWVTKSCILMAWSYK